MIFKTPRLMIAALSGGAGKTLVSLGLAAAWRRRLGLSVVPFKKGPDYIDAGWLAMSADHPCYNLDPFLMGPRDILGSFVRRSHGADVALIEGNRGLYDGVDADGTCSSAELSKLLKAPVVLVLDATKMTRTAAALVLGCRTLDPLVNLSAVILNRVAGARHERVLRDSVERVNGVPVVGVLPKERENLFPERHMGLVPPQEHGRLTEAVARLGEKIEAHVDVERLYEMARRSEPMGWPAFGGCDGASRPTACGVRIGVLRDGAFQFYYPENLETLQELGAELVVIDSMRASHLPDLDALYVGGGFPETHLVQIAGNDRFRASVREAIEAGLPVYAECGGLMFLSRGIRAGGRLHPMVGVLPFEVQMARKPQGHGYTVLETVKDNPFFSRGGVLRGHEFHYSRVVNVTGSLDFAFRLKKGCGVLEGWDGVCYKNVLASYSHLHACGQKEWAEGVVRAAVRYRSRKAAVSGTVLPAPEASEVKAL
ncbi:hydrogenobyrinic acid a,c-diamide synthase (glutamine-hydrolysing) [Desulfacinum hydrothermale DSM 13146]|uniref:Cobyrinate a,c-diamide synthase n=1 Tax=Desulfacinum hydrothermale DSM 13146 TaxID=1121390 RepID=A0A1W1XBB8_9BACT|nr:cobyrinate a,c-diamide synthase [Desulfacinum hydrothermale]SMC21143.1 hydrogenobyrinic acid a,c-diamide synthase (glutamine-hydrolysing) [Desulfacinum hydrothermale DSM 13146]